jgi:hypothetical protein
MKRLITGENVELDGRWKHVTDNELQFQLTQETKHAIQLINES